ncbi:MAG: urate oxidase [Candidatus Eisenbacteria bacterium]|nr:urate oxidase [Candidatus Eisenbacteria bacterium]
MRIEHHRYGKARVRLVKVRRRGDVHDLRDLTVRLLCEGDFDASYVSGDNRDVLPTETMKNMIYALAKTDPVDRIESFALALARLVLAEHAPVRRAIVRIEETPWTRIAVSGPAGPQPHPHAFMRPGGERGVAEVVAERGGAERVASGLRGLRVAKTTASGFEGFPQGRFTTLEGTRDRMFSTEVGATWWWSEEPGDWAAGNSRIRDAMLQAFASEYSPSVQYTIHRMGQAAFAACAQIAKIHVALPNLHCIPVDLAPFGLENPNEVLVPTEEPHGLIEATLARE